MEKQTNTINSILFIIFFSIIAAMSILNFGSIIQAFGAYEDGAIDQLSGDIETTLFDQFYLKDTFVALNGFIGKLIGKRILNETVLLKNGHLISLYDDTVTPGERTYWAAETVVRLNDYLRREGIGFIFAVAPTHFNGETALLPDGLEAANLDGLTEFWDLLHIRSVDVLRIDDIMKENDMNHYDSFFYTDHHWKPEAAFWATNVILKHMSKRYDTALDKKKMDINNYHVDIYKNWFLGSMGRRTGRFFSGLDDISLIHPKFDTGFEVFTSADARSGTFFDVMFNMRNMEKNNLLNSNSYSTYIGGDFPLVIEKNESALNDKKLLVIKDSFALPVQAFLANHFKYIKVIDLRFYSFNSLIQTVYDEKPDIVLALYNLGSILAPIDELFYFGQVSSLITDDTDTVISKNLLLIEDEQDKNITLEGTDDFSFQMLYTHFRPGKKYTLSVDKITVLAGEADYITVKLFDPASTHWATVNYFKTNVNETQHWTFRIPNQSYGMQLLIYPGLITKTKDIKVEISNLTLTTQLVMN
jgi:hypothetical protein